MKGEDFVDVMLVLTDKAFTVNAHGEREPLLYPPTIPVADLEPGLVFSLELSDFRLALRPERWIEAGMVELYVHPEPEEKPKRGRKVEEPTFDPSEYEVDG